VWRTGHPAVPLMLMTDLVRVFKSSERDRIVAIANELRERGVTAAVLPSDQVIGAWHIEVPADDVIAATSIVAGVGER
jgi:hypothetical protein